MSNHAQDPQDPPITLPPAPPYPNALRQKRQEAMITRAQLSLRCEEMARETPTSYVKVSLSTLRDLEGGLRRPRRNTANTLATALHTKAEEIFHSGYDDTPRNPSGKTRVPEDRSRTGRPRKDSP